MFDCYVGLLQGGAFWFWHISIHLKLNSWCIDCSSVDVSPPYQLISLFKWLNGQINELVVSKWQSSANRGENEPLLPFPMNRAKALTGSASPLGLGFATWEHSHPLLSPFFLSDFVAILRATKATMFTLQKPGEANLKNLQPIGIWGVFYRRFPAVTWPAWKVKQEWMIRILRHAFADPPLSTKKAAWNTAARDLSLFGRKTCTICKSLRYQISPHISCTSIMNLHSFCCLELIPTEANQPSTGP